MGGITNVDREGFASAAFHSQPDMMRWDPYSGDYGMGFFGHAYAAATYLIDDPEFGWLGFGGIAEKRGRAVTIVPHDGARTRLFIAPAGLWLTLDSGKIAAARFDPVSGRVGLTLDRADSVTRSALLRVESTTGLAEPYAPKEPLTQARGGYVVGLRHNKIEVVLDRQRR